MQLYNKLSSSERSRIIEKAGKDRLILSFYQYANIGNPEVFRNYIFIEWSSLDVLGRIYVAKEGINAQLSVPAENFDIFKRHLDSISFLYKVRLNIAIKHNNKSFLKLTIKVKDKIVSRKILPISLSYDHRIIDGAEGAKFCVYLGKCLGKDFAFQLAV